MKKIDFAKTITEANKLLRENFKWIDSNECRESIELDSIEKDRVELRSHATLSGKSEYTDIFYEN